MFLTKVFPRCDLQQKIDLPVIGGKAMDRIEINVGDVIEMKKPHPCSRENNKNFKVLRIGMDFKLRCMGCGHEIMLPRIKVEKGFRKLIQRDAGQTPVTAEG